MLAGLRLAQGNLVAVIQHVLEDLNMKSSWRVREGGKKEKLGVNMHVKADIILALISC